MQKILIVLSVMAVMASCNGSKKGKAEQQHTKSEVAGVNQGEILYKRHCNACHQRDAGGVPAMYPPLANNKMVSGEKEPLISVVLNGMSGPVEVNGEKYNGVMASYKNLSDEEIADILNYLRSGFGNKGDEILPDDVKRLR